MTPVAPTVLAPPTVSALTTESAIRLVMLSVAQHRRFESLISASPRATGRLKTLPSSTASHQTRAQSTLLRVVSVLEAHVAQELVRRVEADVPAPRSPILEDIYIAAEDKAIGSWPAIVDCYKRWLQISLRTCVGWTAIQALVDARNAIAHGLGELTRRQARKNLPQLIRSLRAADILVTGARIEVSEASLLSAAHTVRAFLNSLDGDLAAYDAR
jgi:hypothetical protein